MNPKLLNMKQTHLLNKLFSKPSTGTSPSPPPTCETTSKKLYLFNISLTQPLQRLKVAYCVRCTTYVKTSSHGGISAYRKQHYEIKDQLCLLCLPVLTARLIVGLIVKGGCRNDVSPLIKDGGLIHHPK